MGLDWLLKGSQCSKYYIESEIVHPYSLEALFHAKWKSVCPDLQRNILLRDTVIAWRENLEKTKTFPPTFPDIFLFIVIPCFHWEWNIRPSPYGVKKVSPNFLPCMT